MNIDQFKLTASDLIELVQQAQANATALDALSFAILVQNKVLDHVKSTGLLHSEANQFKSKSRIDRTAHAKLTVSTLEDLKKFICAFESLQVNPLSKEKMDNLCRIGLVRMKSNGLYEPTKIGGLISDDKALFLSKTEIDQLIENLSHFVNPKGSKAHSGIHLRRMMGSYRQKHYFLSRKVQDKEIQNQTEESR